MREERIFTIGKSEKAVQVQSFTVVKDCTWLTIQTNIKVPYSLLVFLVIHDSKGNIRFQKQIAYGEQMMVLGRDGLSTTNGGVPGPIEAGKWTIETKVFSEYVKQKMQDEVITYEAVISDEKYSIEECIGSKVWTDEELNYKYYNWVQCYKQEARWYKGDFHTHTRLSDGKESVASATEKAKITELDFYVATEHNVVHTGWQDTELLVLPGVELTTEIGHCNVFGITKIPDALQDIMTKMGEKSVCEEMEQVIKEGKERGWLFSVNHPFLSIWSFHYDELALEKIDSLEIINDPTYPGAREANDKAIRFLDVLFQDGYQITGIGGSDSHNLLGEYYQGATTDSIAGDPGSYVYCEKMTPKEILKGVSQGNCVVTRFCKVVPEIIVNQKKYLPGSQIKNQNGCVVVFKIYLIGLQEEPVCYGYCNGERQALEVMKNRTGDYVAAMKVVAAKNRYHWIRVEARKKNGELLAYVNPLFIGEKLHRLHTFGDAVIEMER